MRSIEKQKETKNREILIHNGNIQINITDPKNKEVRLKFKKATSVVLDYARR